MLELPAGHWYVLDEAVLLVDVVEAPVGELLSFAQDMSTAIKPSKSKVFFIELEFVVALLGV
jgi:hypothetical protein